MITIGNDQLQVQILDPDQDKARFGTRYCTGGYIFQIIDSDKGELLSGPTFPDSFNTFDGQGIPDAFARGPIRDKKSTSPEALILGIGICNMETDRVVEFCTWEQLKTASVVEMRTQHQFQGHQVTLVRRVSVLGRTVRSFTSLSNEGAPLVFSWFPHPFYPQPKGPELCAFNLGYSFPSNPGYRQAENGFLHRNGPAVTPGHFLALNHDSRAPLSVWQRHDLLGLVGARCDYVPTGFPIWGNARTFSWEPYLERSLFTGQNATWNIDYDF